MTEYKTIDGDEYMFAGSKKLKADAKKQADKYSAQGRLCRVFREERKGIRQDSRLRGYRFVYALYTRSK